MIGRRGGFGKIFLNGYVQKCGGKQFGNFTKSFQITRPLQRLAGQDPIFVNISFVEVYIPKIVVVGQMVGVLRGLK